MLVSFPGGCADVLTCVFRTTRTRLLLRPGRLHCLSEYRAGRSTPHPVRSRRFNFPPSAPFPPFWEPFPPRSMKAYMTKRPGSKKGLPAWRTETEAHTTFQTRCVPTMVSCHSSLNGTHTIASECYGFYWIFTYNDEGLFCKAYTMYALRPRREHLGWRPRRVALR